ncbi:hypothetical protein H4R35_006934, partial [Dimargaris xerosporica]
STAATSASAAVSPMPEIPGFYYSPERNRYFKIEGASTHSHNPSSKVALTQRQQTSDWNARADQQVRNLTQVSLSRSQVVGLDINLERHQIMATTLLGATL